MGKFSQNAAFVCIVALLSLSGRCEGIVERDGKCFRTIEEETGIPLLKDIPLIGKCLFSTRAVREVEVDDDDPAVAEWKKERAAASRTAAPDAAAQTAACYTIITCERERGHDFAYRFVLELKEEAAASLAILDEVKREFRASVARDYVETFKGGDPRFLCVDFPEYALDGRRITGRAVALVMTPVSLDYDADACRGRLAVRFAANQFEEARAYIRNNIETLARDKNIALVTGEIPPAAKFYLGREEIKDGNILEIEFKTE